MGRPNTTGAKVSRGPLLRVISNGQSPPVSATTILTKPARARAHSVLPTTYEEVTPSSLSTMCQPLSPSPVSPRAYNILDNPARARSLPSIQNTHSSSPSVRQSRSPPQITILGNLEQEKREAHARPTPSLKDILRKAGARLLPPISRSRSPLHIAILSDPEKEKREAGNLINPSMTRSLPSVSQSHSPPHITTLSNPERERRETHPHPPPKPKSIPLNPASSSSVCQPLSPAHIATIINPKMGKREAHPRPTQRIKSFWNALAALAPKRVPTVTITPISILKARTPPPEIPAPAPAADPNPDTVKENFLRFQLSDIVVEERVRDPETSTLAGSDAVMTSKGEILGVPLADWRGRRFNKDELGWHYPDEPFNGQFDRRLHSMVRKGNRAAAARHRDQARRRRQAATTAAIDFHFRSNFHSYYSNRQRLRSLLPHNENCLNPLCGSYALPHTCIPPGNHSVRAS